MFPIDQNRHNSLIILERAPNSLEQAIKRKTNIHQATMFGRQPTEMHWIDFKAQYETKPGKRRNKSQKPSRLYRLMLRYAKWSRPDLFPECQKQETRPKRKDRRQKHRRPRTFAYAVRGNKIRVVNVDDYGRFTSQYEEYDADWYNMNMADKNRL